MLISNPMCCLSAIFVYLSPLFWDFGFSDFAFEKVVIGLFLVTALGCSNVMESAGAFTVSSGEKLLGSFGTLC
jgi:hypothetical protein